MSGRRAAGGGRAGVGGAVWQVRRRLGSVRFPLAAPTWPGTVPRPAPASHLGTDYRHDWSRRYPARLARAMVLDNVARPLARVMAPTTVRGSEHLAQVEGPVIFVANHASHLDTPLLLTLLPPALRHRTVVAAAADYFFDRRWKAFMWSLALAAVPIDRNRVNRRSADTAVGLLEDGWSLVIFPEGGRSPDGWAQPFRGGAAYLARRTGRPVVPVYLHGTRDVIPKATTARRSTGSPRPLGGSGTEGLQHPVIRRAPVVVLFGEALVPDDGEDARHFGARIEEAVATLAEEVATDWWTARRRVAAGNVTSSLRGPEGASWRRAWALGVSRPSGSPATSRKVPAPKGARMPWPTR